MIFIPDCFQIYINNIFKNNLQIINKNYEKITIHNKKYIYNYIQIKNKA